MRRLVPALILLAVAGTIRADVRMLVRRDGKKVIYNVGSYGRGSDYGWLARQHDRRSMYDPIIERYAARFDVDPVLVRAVIQVESDFNPRCVSNKGARGLMQLMPETARRYNVSSMHDPEQNIRGGVAYLRDLLTMFRGDLQHALAAYNAGEGAVAKYRGVPPYEETTVYVRRALTVYYGRPWGQATTFAGGRGTKRLQGGFGASLMQPLAVLPGMRYLGSE